MTEDSWTTVCLDGFDGAAATVVCRQLGYENGSYYSMYVYNVPCIQHFDTSDQKGKASCSV